MKKVRTIKDHNFGGIAHKVGQVYAVESDKDLDILTAVGFVIFDDATKLGAPKGEYKRRDMRAQR